MVDAIHEGKVKGIYLFGEDMYSADSNANYVGAAFSMLDFFVVQDIFFSETCRFADVVLPASPSLEKEGTFTSTERRIQRLYEVFEPLGESKPDWKIVQEIANRLGAKWNYTHPADMMHESAITRAYVCRRDVRSACRIQDSAVAGGNRWHGSAAAVHREVQLSRRQSEFLSDGLDSALRCRG